MPARCVGCGAAALDTKSLAIAGLSLAVLVLSLMLLGNPAAVAEHPHPPLRTFPAAASACAPAPPLPPHATESPSTAPAAASPPPPPPPSPPPPVPAAPSPSPAPQTRLLLGAGLSLLPPTMALLQATLDCWMAVGAGGGAWVDASPATGSLYPAGAHIGKHAGGTDSLRWEPAAACGAPWQAWGDGSRARRVLTRFGGVFFAGDSISEQQASSLQSAFPRDAQPVAIGNVRDDRAQWSLAAPTKFDDALSDFIQEPWAHFLPAVDNPYAILVINRGAHYVVNATFVAELDATLTAVRAERPNVLLVWRASVPGSAQCQLFAGQPPLADLSTVPPRETWPWHWELFEGQNALARALIRERHPHVLILDPVAPCMLRPGTRLSAVPPRSDDGDCLHWAMPGPPDMWNIMLIEALALADALAAYEASSATVTQLLAAHAQRAAAAAAAGSGSSGSSAPG